MDSSTIGTLKRFSIVSTSQKEGNFHRPRKGWLQEDVGRIVGLGEARNISLCQFLDGKSDRKIESEAFRGLGLDFISAESDICLKCVGSDKLDVELSGIN